MKSVLVAVCVTASLILSSCQTAPALQPETTPESMAAVPQEESGPIGSVEVNASALNVRSEPSMDGEILTQIKRGERLPLLEVGENWMMVELPDGRSGWSASRFLLRDGEKAPKTRRRGSCLPDSDFALASAPTPTFSDSGSHGDVVVEALVDANGKVKSTKVIRNSTGDEALGFLTEREIRSATFVAPVRDCRPREFIYTYTRSF